MMKIIAVFHYYANPPNYVPLCCEL